MGSKSVLSVYEIKDEDVQALFYTIGMGKSACMVYSFTLNAGQIFEKVKRKMSTIRVGEGYEFQCAFDDEGNLYVDGEDFQWGSSLIESVDDNFAAMIIHIMPMDNGMSYDQKQYFITVCGRIETYLHFLLKLDECAVDIIDIPQKSKPLQNNGFSFSHSELADAFRKSVIIKPPFQTTLNGMQIKKPGWYVTGFSARNLSTGKPNTSGGGCYIATAVYGSYDCPQVWTLRRFRDYTLAKSCYGRIFIKCYYTISPILVMIFGNAGWFKYFWRKRLDRLVSSLKDKGYDDGFYNGL